MSGVDEWWVVLDGLDRYSVSSYGRVVNNETGRELKPTLNRKTGLLKVTLSYNAKRYHVYVHRLVARCFFLNYKDGVKVRHISENLLDNSVLNLTLGNGCRTPDTELGKG